MFTVDKLFLVGVGLPKAGVIVAQCIVLARLARATQVGGDSERGAVQERAFGAVINEVQFTRSNDEHFLRGIIQKIGGYTEPSERTPHGARVVVYQGDKPVTRIRCAARLILG